MINTTPELAAWMDTAIKCIRIDLYTLTLTSGTVLRWCGSTTPVTLPDGRSFACGPFVERNKLSIMSGIQVDELQLDITPRPADLIGGVPLLRLARLGGLRGCTVLLEWAYFDEQLAFKGVMPKFQGSGSPTGFDATTITLQVKSELERLLIMMPRDVFQATCLNTLYDAGCGKSRAVYTVTGTCTGAAFTGPSAFTSDRTEAAGYFEQGVLRFTSGANAGVSRTVRSYAGGTFSFALPFPFPFEAGDAFSVYPGCDGEKGTCQTKFANLLRFRGQPYIPAPEVAT